jgi:hypothetical protein
MTTRLAKDFRSFADLAAAYARDKDYRIVLISRPASGVRHGDHRAAWRQHRGSHVGYRA